MKPELASMLVHPDIHEMLTVQADKVGSIGIETGRLVAASGEAFPIEAGIPRFARSIDGAQMQTSESFDYKWGRQDTYESAAVRRAGLVWLLERYGFEDGLAMRRFFESKGTVLDLGCGSGYSSSLWMDGRWDGAMWVGVDISGAIDVASRRLGGLNGTHFVQADALRLPFRPQTFGSVFAEGVLHHTPSTRAALAAATQVLRFGGEILFYVYRRKGPIREFTDEHVRARLSDMPPAAAWDALRPLTRLGQALAEAKATIDVPEDVPLLGVKAGPIDIQRLFYWHVAKVFWNPELTFEENHHVNFDWYHPAYAHRQTEDDVRTWCADLGLRIIRFNGQESGFTVRAIRDQQPTPR